MTWEIALQTFSAGLAGIAVWFIYDLIAEYKGFKKESNASIVSLEKVIAHLEDKLLLIGPLVDDMKKALDFHRAVTRRIDHHDNELELMKIQVQSLRSYKNGK